MKRNARRFVGEPDGKRQLRRPRRRWEDDIKLFLKRDVKTWIGFIWLRVGTSYRLLFTRLQNFVVHKYGEFLLLLLRVLSLLFYEGKSLNNRNFIITFLQEYLQKLFVSYFPTQSPRFAAHPVHLSTNFRMPSRKKKAFWRGL